MFRELAVGVIACVQMVYAQPSEVTPLPAVPYIVGGFDRYQLVAVSEMHGSRETMALLAAVIRQPGFAGKVSDIVVEFGNARYQSLMDRYIAGENVRDSDLRQAWENTTQISGVWSSPIYRVFFADVRAFNATLPMPKRVRAAARSPESFSRPLPSVSRWQKPARTGSPKLGGTHSRRGKRSGTRRVRLLPRTSGLLA